jgi:hypothetical protein
MKKKTKYRVRNWKEYNRSLMKRGSLTFRISDELIDNWIEKEESRTRGRAFTYSAAAIMTMACVKFVFHQAGRQTRGLIESIFRLLKVPLSVPDHSTLSRRMSGLKVALPIRPSTAPRHIVCDSTGLKVYGEGEWKVRTHGFSKRRTWRKLHLQIDAATGEIVASAASGNKVSDDSMFERLIEENEQEIGQISADGAYDRWKVYEAIKRRGIERVAIPPQKRARIKQHGNCKAPPLVRDENLRAIRRHGRAKWKREAGYHRRSLAETGMFRFKRTFTDKLQSRSIENEFQEMRIKCAILNRMTHLGKPESCKVT